MNEIPAHWKEILNGILFKENVRKPMYNDIPLSLSQKDGLIPTDLMKENSLKTSSYDNWKRVLKRDLVLNRFKAHLGVMMASDYEGMVSFHYGVYEPQLSLNTKYYELLYHTDVYKGIYAYSSNGMTVGLQNLSNLAFYGIRGLYPPVDEQEKIVSYIESKTSKIDEYIAERERELQLLNELKEAEIAKVVTQGLNPNVKMKDSGISWIGLIPEHWEVRHLSQIAYEHYISNKDVHHQNLLSLSYGRIIRKDINTTEGLLPASFDTYQIVEEGNIVMRLTDLQNDHKSLRVGLVKEDGIVTSAYVCLGVFDSIVPSYLYNILHSYDIKKLFYSMGGGLRQNLNWQGLKKLDIPLPPLDEQQAIVTYINDKTAKVESLITELQAEIDYLKEYKQRLIADCVTGQVNVQNATL